MTSTTSPAGGDDDVLLERQLVMALSTASRAVEIACTPVLQELNLTHPQYLVMLALWEKNPRPAREIDDLLPEPGKLSPALRELEEAGYIQSVRIQDHKDASTVNLTAKGTALYRRTLAISGTILGRLGLSPEDAEGLYDAMPRLLKASGSIRGSKENPPKPVYGKDAGAEGA
jgi:MarR family transcriptional regulator, organic hydroperoxide resistance regulator